MHIAYRVCIIETNVALAVYPVIINGMEYDYAFGTMYLKFLTFETCFLSTWLAWIDANCSFWLIRSLYIFFFKFMAHSCWWYQNNVFDPSRWICIIQDKYHKWLKSVPRHSVLITCLKCMFILCLFRNFRTLCCNKICI